MRGKEILLVDDEILSLEPVVSEMEAHGYIVTTAENGVDAVINLRQGKYDMVITDIVMEGLDGMQLLRMAKETDSEVPVIILTAHGSLESAIDAMQLGANDYVLKPCNIDELLIRMLRCLELRELKKKIKLYECLLPVCAVCKKVRDDTGKKHGEGEWMPLENYISKNIGIEMSHTYCHECMEKFGQE